METILTNMCMIENDQDEVVVQKRVKEWSGCVFPGGKVEPNESFVDSVKREIKEETNLTLKSVKLVGLKQFPYNGKLFIVMLFKSTDFFGTLQSSSEGEVFWCKKDKLVDLDSPITFKEMLPIFDDESISEMQLLEKDDEWSIIIK